MSKNNRDNFLESVKRDLRDRVGSHCSNPDCDVLTIAASNESNSSINNIGIAAHICAAASGKGARRYKPEPEMTSEQRSSIDNGIWLCASCATMIDKDEVTYTEALLQQWKLQAEERAKYRRGKKLYDQKEIEAIVAPHVKQHHLDTEQIKGLTVAVTALSQKGELGTAAIEAFKQDNLSLAKDLFKLETQRAEMAAKQGAEAYRNLGAIAFLDNTQEALNAYRRATELDPDNADGWNDLGILFCRLGKFKEATSAYIAALNLGKKHQNKIEIANSYSNLGNVYLLLGQLDNAITFYSYGLILNEELGNKKGMADNYGNLGVAYQKREELDKAVIFQQKSLEINEDIGNKKGKAAAYTNLGILYLLFAKFFNSQESSIRLNEAINYFQESFKLCYALGDKEGMAENSINLGRTNEELGDKTAARSCYQKSIELFKESGNPNAEKVQALLDALQ
jgi:tetratricopeptide (TPR) repeat protein